MPVNRTRIAAATTLAGLGTLGGATVRAYGGTTFVARTYAATLLWALAGVVAGQRGRSATATLAAAAAAVPTIAALADRRRSS